MDDRRRPGGERRYRDAAEDAGVCTPLHGYIYVIHERREREEEEGGGWEKWLDFISFFRA